ncbi:MAG: flavodoxin family protein [Syntrophobacterales bacterium]|nr:flavodoxin family protein [Syntrophobacterales bacterium]
MKTLTALLASPRKPGNGEIFMRAVARELGSGWQLEIIRLIEWDIRPCRACYSCLFEKCPQRDDMGEIISRVISSDAVAVVAPTYFLGANSLIKRFIDRGLMFYEFIDKMWDKPMVSVTTAGIDGMEGYAKLMLDSAVKIMGGRLLASVVVYGAFPGEAIIGEKNQSLVKLVADSIVNGRVSSSNENSIVCPLCGGDSFRFLGGEQVRCLLCSNTGSYKVDRGRVFMSIEPGEHQLFLSLQQAIDHAEWLRSMKKRFLQLRTELKSIVQEVSRVGKIIHPKETKKVKEDEEARDSQLPSGS